MGAINGGYYLSDSIAAIDLGSNSFHLLVARPMNKGIQVIDQDKEMVRLAAGLQADRTLDSETKERALECLSRFGQRIRHISPTAIRIVGTNTLRAARKSKKFIKQAQLLLGHEIEIISGIEEARLIYLGVAHSIAGDKGRRMVVDIGGGSTEIIVGERFEPLRMESLYMGCVSMTRRYFADGTVSARQVAQARLAALLELEPHIKSFRKLGWAQSIGASGTARAVESVARANGWANGDITAEALAKIIQSYVQAGSLDATRLAGLKAERSPVFLGGAIILAAVIEAFDIPSMMVSSGALREGLLYDLIGRSQEESTRQQAVVDLQMRCRLNKTHASRVEKTAIALWRQVAADNSLADSDSQKMLGWAACLHELGLSIAHSQHHKHAGYFLRHADLSGFSWQEQQVLAAIVQAHRRSFPQDLFDRLPGVWRQKAIQLALLLRLAVILHRSRSSASVPVPDCQLSETSISLSFSNKWLHQHPLSLADFEEEARRLAKRGIAFNFKSKDR
ncbi:Exopolyphosphatase [hydrothermal vent metagenome]|uniref:Exopolyphosphatase n=1 Tax=hydrothermal vent metagenome TaxID=652676 RepID=A0A3B1BQA0_9ZZZZ